jgi:hypothetical protein
MGRSEGDFKHLLDTDADQNIGNSIVLQPQMGTVGTIIPQTNPARLLQLTGPSKTGKTTSIVFTASRIVGSNNPNPGYAGPITGVVEFGNGARFTRAEFDIPLGPFAGTFHGASVATEPQDGGVIVTVPTGVLRAYVRYDNLLIQPILGSPPFMSLAQFLGVAVQGPGGPVTTTPAEPILAKAMAAYYTRHFSRLYKTQYCYVGAPATAAQYIGQVQYCIPPFARSVKILRFNGTTGTSPSMTIFLYDNVMILEKIVVPAGPSATIELTGNESIIGVASTANTDTIHTLALCYEIGL